jgi:hypothetical protein
MYPQRLAVTVSISVLLAAGCGAPESATTDWVSLFNGTDLSGWTPKIRGYPAGQDPLNTFRVEDGLLTVGFEAYGPFDERFGHLFHEEEFSHYQLQIEYRFIGDQAEDGPGWALRNSGVMVHAQSPESMPAAQDFPISIEAQFLGGNGVDERPTANLCTPGTHVEINGEFTETHCINSTSATFHGEEWVTVDLFVRGDESIVHVVNGDTVLAYARPVIGGGVVDGFDPAVKQDGRPLTGGFIALQSESHPVQFRQVRIRRLPR